MFSNFIFQGELSEEVLLPGPVQESFLFAIAHSRPWHSFLPGMFWAKVAELEIAHGNLVNVNENWSQISHMRIFVKQNVMVNFVESLCQVNKHRTSD